MVVSKTRAVQFLLQALGFFYLRVVLGECFFRLAGGKEKVTEATSQFTRLEKFSLNFSSSSIVIVVNHLHP